VVLFCADKRGGLQLLIDQATSKFLPLNILIFCIICLVFFTLEFGLSPESRIRKSIDRFTESSLYIVIVWVIFFIEAGRLSAASFLFRTEDFKMLAEKVQALEASTKDEKPVKGPVEFIYLDRAKIESTFDQILPTLQLEQKKVGKKESGTLHASGKIPAVEVGGEHLNEQITEETYTQSEKTLIRKTVDLINKLSDQKLLSVIKTIEIQSPQLSKFDKAVNLIKKSYKLPLPDDQVTTVREELITKYLDQSTTTTFPMNGWILISGTLSVKWLEGKVVFTFNYVPSIPSKVQFFFEIPRSKTAENDVESLLGNDVWDMGVFGKLINKDQKNGNVLYRVQCYAPFR